jgi:hypothetical protein
MNESATALCDEDVFNDELPDAVLEIAGSKLGDGAAASVTAAFCSGLDPARPLPEPKSCSMTKSGPAVRRPFFPHELADLTS